MNIDHIVCGILFIIIIAIGVICRKETAEMYKSWKDTPWKYWDN